MQQVFIVTGGYSGVGYELSKIPYGKHGTIDIAGRNQEKAEDAINGIRSVGRSSHGQLEFLKLGLANFASIPESAADFLSRETRLDALKNNAGPIGPDACTRAMVVSAICYLLLFFNLGRRPLTWTSGDRAYDVHQLPRPVLFDAVSTTFTSGNYGIVVPWFNSREEEVKRLLSILVH
jgi:NAD(P)-dependent dehydrogenase (short-subunit alcohol dehydrogenase family)